MSNQLKISILEKAAEKLENHHTCKLSKSEILSIILDDLDDDLTVEETVQETSLKNKPKPKIKSSNTTKNISDSENLHTESNLSKMKVSELKEICGELGISKTGTKAVLVKKILDNDSNKPVIKKISNYMLKTIETVPSTTGNGTCVMVGTGFIFHNKVDKVIGKEVEIDGKIVREDLTEDDIELVRQYGLDYEYPKNLNSTSSENVDENEPEVFDEINYDEDEEDDEDDEEEEFIVED